MLKKWLRVAGILALVLGIALYGLSFYPATESKEVERQIGSQTGAVFVKFTLPSNYNDVITFYANGSYSIVHPLMLKIANQTGTIEYYMQAVDFPIQAHLFGSKGEYVAVFEGLETENSTKLTVTVKETVNQTSFPYFYLALCSPISLLGIYLIFASSDNPKNKLFLKPFMTFILIPSTVLAIIIAITFGISASFPDYIKVQAAMDVLKALAEADGVMLGLSGIMFAQLFSSIMGFQNVMFERRLTQKKNPDYEPCRKEIADRKRALIVATVGTIGFFLASIIASLISLATVGSFNPEDTYAPFGLVLSPIYCLVIAVTLLIIALAGVSIEPPLNEKKEES